MGVSGNQKERGFPVKNRTALPVGSHSRTISVKKFVETWLHVGAVKFNSIFKGLKITIG